MGPLFLLRIQCFVCGCVKLSIALDYSFRAPGGVGSSVSAYVPLQGNRVAKFHYPSYLLPALPKCGEQHVPYIFSVEELRRIFEWLDTLIPTNLSPNRHLTMPLLFRMLYGCGLRISEALALLKSDVDLKDGVLHIRHGKNDRERNVPMSVSLTEE